LPPGVPAAARWRQPMASTVISATGLVVSQPWISGRRSRRPVMPAWWANDAVLSQDRIALVGARQPERRRDADQPLAGRDDDTEVLGVDLGVGVVGVGLEGDADARALADLEHHVVAAGARNDGRGERLAGGPTGGRHAGVAVG